MDGEGDMGTFHGLCGHNLPVFPNPDVPLSPLCWVFIQVLAILTWLMSSVASND
jgi:hypothetical protein